MAQLPKEETVVMLPFMAQGHIIPAFSLAMQIQQTRGYSIIFVNTPLNIKRIKSSLPSHNKNIHFVALPYCSTDHGLPPDSENTDSLPAPLTHLLVRSTQSLEPAFRNLILDIIKEQGHPPLCIIADTFFGWIIDIAKEFGIFNAMFNGGGAYGTAIFFSLWLNLPQNETDSDEIELPDFPEVSRIHRSQIPRQFDDANGTNSWSIFFINQVSLCLQRDAILINTVEGLEGAGLTYFRRKSGRPVWPIGPTLSSITTKARPRKEHGIGVDLCIEWLDTHQPNSVLYVSFGTEMDISASQTMELAMALEARNKNFIWVIKPPSAFDRSREFRAADWLPEGFEKRMKEDKRGLLEHKWAPQLEILSHKSTGAFLSHCGWNSALETLRHGVPIIAWPLAAEQFFNAKLFEEEIGVCVEVARGNECEVSKDHIVKVINLAMEDTEKAKEMRKKASEVKQMIEDAVMDEKDYKGYFVKAMDELFNAALSKRKAKNQANGKA